VAGRSGCAVRYREPAPLPVVVARRSVALPLNRTLELVAIEDDAGHCDVWLRMRNPAGQAVGQFFVRPGSLREIAAAIDGLAGELGCEP